MEVVNLEGKKLSECLGIKVGDVLSITGAGGKTTLMFMLARELKATGGKILATTTTKIFLPEKSEADWICRAKEEFEQHVSSTSPGVYVFGTRLIQENKLEGLTQQELEGVKAGFDWVIVEADGAKRKLLKGWQDHEPAIFFGTTKTVGVLNMKAMKLKVCEDDVHRSRIFAEISASEMGENIGMEHLVRMICHPRGLFKDALGERILMLVVSDDERERTAAEQIAQKLQLQNPDFLHRIVIGNLMTEGETHLKNEG